MHETKSLKDILAMLDKDINESQRIFDSGNIGKIDNQTKALKRDWGAEIGFRDEEPNLRTLLLGDNLKHYIKQMKNYRLLQLEKLNNIQNNQTQITNIQVGNGNQAINAKNSSDINIDSKNHKKSFWRRIVAYVLGFFGIR